MATYSLILGLALTLVGWVGVRLGLNFALALGLFSLGIVWLAGLSVWGTSLGVGRFLLLLPLLAVLPSIYKGFKVPPVADVATRWDPVIDFLEPTKSLNPVTPTQPVLAAHNGAYGHIRDIQTPNHPAAALNTYAQQQGWTPVSETPEGIQWAVTTRLFGFTDDVVVRWSEQDGVFTVAARSKSRVGTSDLGANAERLELLLLAVAAD